MVLFVGRVRLVRRRQASVCVKTVLRDQMFPKNWIALFYLFPEAADGSRFRFLFFNRRVEAIYGHGGFGRRHQLKVSFGI